MFQQAPSFFAAFTAGFLSFLTPCVLPLVPGYISFISGVSLSDLQQKEGAGGWKKLIPVMLSTLAFVIGFSLVFVSTGALIQYLGGTLAEYKVWLVRAAGLVIIIFGLHMAGAFKIQALLREKRLDGGAKGGGIPRAFALGVAFAFGWTPCVGPILGAILGLAASQDKIGQAVILMCLYSAGLAIPFFLTGLAVDSFFKAFDKIKRHFRKIEIVAGSLLVVIGVVMFLNQFDLLKDLFLYIVPEKLNTLG